MWLQLISGQQQSISVLNEAEQSDGCDLQTNPTVLQALTCLLVDKMTGTIDSRHVLLVFYCLNYGAVL